MPNINKNIIKQAGAAVANATNKAAGLTAATPEPGIIISAIQLVNGGRTIGPDALAHFTESVRNKLLSLLVNMEPLQSGSGTPSPDNVRPISGRTGLTIYVSPTPTAADATTYAVDWTSQAGTVYHGTVDPVSGQLTVDWAMVDMGTLNWSYFANNKRFVVILSDGKKTGTGYGITSLCSAYQTSVGVYGTLPDKCLSVGSNFISGSSCSVVVHDESFSNAATFKTAMSGVQLCYELATPLTYQLSAQDVVTLVGDNYIWSDSGDVTITE